MVGEWLGRYEILGPLGAGGMGEVYRARDANLDRDVAIKVLPESFASEGERRARFEREAKLLARLNHPNIATIHSLEQHGTVPFLVLEIVEGRSLAQVLPSGPLAVDEALAVCRQVADALQVAHDAGIVHRDLKPANVMVTSDGRAKVLDFGIAKGRGAEGVAESRAATELTASGALLGTVSYMSPEQVRGLPADERSDLWAFGCLLYETLSGSHPFARETGGDTLAAIVGEEPDWERVPESPVSLRPLVRRLLEKDPDSRFQSAREVGILMARCEEESAGASGADRPFAALVGALRQPVIGVPVLAFLALLVFFGYRTRAGAARAARARTELLPEIRRLADAGDLRGAYELAEAAERDIPDDPVLAGLMSEVSSRLSLVVGSEGVEIAGADVYIRDYGDVDGEWSHLGRSPLGELRLARGVYVIRVEKPGYETREIPVPLLVEASGGRLFMVEQGSVPEGMVWVAGADLRPRLSLLTHLPRIRLPAFPLDRFEVTNRQYQEFVNANGYERRDLWTEPFVLDGEPLDWDAAMARLRDATGQPGPATWRVSRFPEGEDDLPARGVSWYEAAAYCRFVGKSLPTLYHWSRAADPNGSSWILRHANFSGESAVPVGSTGSLTRGGYDLAGNVREWLLNSRGQQRFIAGGAWNDPPYMFLEPHWREPFDRSQENGFRCMAPGGADPIPALAAAELEPVARDYSREQPVSDELFEAYRGLYGYDDSPLNASEPEDLEDTPSLLKQKVEIDTAYGERMSIYLFLPKGAAPPYQPVVFFPGAGTNRIDRSSETLSGLWLEVWETGRALIYPVYKGTYERRGDFDVYGDPSTDAYRDHHIELVQDGMRAIDYLESRPDLFDVEKLGYLGNSWGGRLGLMIPAIDTRFRAAVLLAGGLTVLHKRPEVEGINFITRNTTPTRMINGEHDPVFPVEIAQVPAFELLGAAPEDKDHVVLPGVAHALQTVARDEVVRLTLDWFDRHLGEVRR